MKLFAARAPALDIFSSGYVLRDPSGWKITQRGREFLDLIESPSTQPTFLPVALPLVVCGEKELPTNIIQLVGYRLRRAA
jgi:hypothetical protein